MTKLKTLLLVLAAAALTSSAALAAPPATHPGNGAKPPTTGAGCKPQVTVVLHGALAAAPGTSPTLPFSLMVTVASANRHGHAYVKATQPVAVTVTASTKISREGARSLASLLAGDRVTIDARPCAADLAAGATPALTATMVSAHPAASS
jgi:hypothetical protein